MKKAPQSHNSNVEEITALCYGLNIHIRANNNTKAMAT